MVLRSRGLPSAALALRCSAAQKCRQPSEGANPPPSPARTSRCARGGSPPRVWRWGWSRRRPRRGSAGRRHPPLLRCGRYSCSACCSARRRLLAASPRRSRRSRPTCCLHGDLGHRAADHQAARRILQTACPKSLQSFKSTILSLLVWYLLLIRMQKYHFEYPFLLLQIPQSLIL